MAKKIAPKLINDGEVIYAVLSPGNGFMKELYGDIYFDDNLPRASGCFTTKQEAVTAHDRAQMKTRFRMEEAIEIQNKAATAEIAEANEYFVNLAREKFQQAQTAIIVQLSVQAAVVMKPTISQMKRYFIRTSEG